MAEIKTKETRKIKFIRLADFFIFSLLLILLSLIIFSSSKANIQTDSVDYYAILQRLTDSSKNSIVRNLHFAEQRSPGYSIISMIPYYFTSFAIEPFVETEETIDAGDEMELLRPPKPEEESRKPHIDKPARNKESEKMRIPSSLLFTKDIFFKNFYIERENSWFEWKIIFALILTSYTLLFAGIIFNVKTLALRNKEIIGASLPMLVIFTSIIFMHNIINTPAYATLAAFGLSSIFCFFFVRSFEKKSVIPQFLAGLFLGLLVLTRLEAVIIAGILCLFLIFCKKWTFLKNLILGGSLSFVILLLYNFFRFGTPFHLGILRGDINQLGFDFNYVFANIFNPKSGMIFWSPLISVGLIGLFLGRKKHLIALGISSLVLIGLFFVRVPVMYECIRSGPINIGGLLVTCPDTMEDALMLVRFDINRYITILAPFAILGLQNLLIILGGYFKKEFATKEENC